MPGPILSVSLISIGRNAHIITQPASGYGEARHQAEWSSMGCQVPTSSTSQAVFPGGAHQKPDCIIARSGRCEIWQFKPDSPDGRDLGPKQAADYRTHVPRYYTDLLRRDEEPDSSHGGADFMKALKQYCYDKDDNEIVFSTVDVKYYRMCERQYVCESP